MSVYKLLRNKDNYFILFHDEIIDIVDYITFKSLESIIKIEEEWFCDFFDMALHKKSYSFTNSMNIILTKPYKIRVSCDLDLDITYISQRDNLVYNINLDYYKESRECRDEYVDFFDARCNSISIAGFLLETKFYIEDMDLFVWLNNITELHKLKRFELSDLTDDIFKNISEDIKDLQELFNVKKFNYRFFLHTKNNINGDVIDFSSLNLENSQEILHMIGIRYANKVIMPRINLNNLYRLEKPLGNNTRVRMIDFRNCYGDLLDNDILRKESNAYAYDFVVLNLELNKSVLHFLIVPKNSPNFVKELMKSDKEMEYLGIMKETELDNLAAKCVLIGKNKTYLVEIE